MVFMADMNRSALEKRARVESLKSMGVTKNISTLALTAEECESKSTASVDDKSRYEQRYETLKQKNGTCKVCSKYHTYKDRFGKFWPSNRFVTCEKFKSMNVKQRAQALEKNKACARCTSWAHNRSNCTAKVVTCEEKINGANCGLDHSKLVCGSGVAYVMTLKTKSNNKIAQNSGDLFDEDAATISYQQDIPIKSKFGNVFARTFWETGSNRVLINSNFAKELNLKPRSSTVTLNVAGVEKKRIETSGVIVLKI